MRSSSLARIVMTSLGIAVVITPGCDTSVTPTPKQIFWISSISPREGSILGGTVARLEGGPFQPGDTVTVDGTHVEATVLSATTITLTMPAHPAGTVVVTVTRVGARVQAQASSRQFSYFGPPVIKEFFPNVGSTGGGTPVYIQGSGFFRGPLTVRVDGIVTPFDHADDFDSEYLYLLMPAHVAGTVEVSVTDGHGQVGRGMFTYASPATFDVNGDWQGWARLKVEVPGDLGARFVLTIRDNMAVSVVCSVCRPGENCVTVSGPSLTLDPPAVVANGEISSAGSGGVSITGKILSPIYATGSINTASCGDRSWWADKRQ
jgi:hypothetical protein